MWQEELEQYCKNVETGEIPTGVHVKNAVKRYRKDLQRKDIVFKEDKVLKVIDFIYKIKHFAGRYNRQHFKLIPWQAFIISNLYGFYKLDGTRRFQTAYLEMARKQGKTALVAALSLYHLLADDEAAAEILFAANSRDQAKIGFTMTHGFATGLDKEGTLLKKYRYDINYPATNSFIKTLAADSSRLDGYNCSFGVVDEYHSAPNSQVRDVIRSSQGMRVNPLLVTITTAGFDKSLPCYELHTVCTEIIAGIKEDDSFFGIIYSLDEEDDWRDPTVWIKSNPNLGITINSDFIQRQVQQAINSPNDEVGVKTKNLNIWCDSATTWIPDTFIVKATEKLDIADFEGEDCYVGVDLASNVDLTAVSYLFVKGEGEELKYYFFTDFYIPSDTLKIRNLHADKELYKTWVHKKYLKITAGNVTDYDYITKDVLDINEKSTIQKIYYDKYNSTQWAIQCTEEGLPMEPFSQTIGNFNIPTKAFERLMLGGKVILDDSPITRYCLRNVELKMDWNGNVKPNKDQEKKKIDGVISMLQALAVYLDITKNYKGIQFF